MVLAALKAGRTTHTFAPWITGYGNLGAAVRGACKPNASMEWRRSAAPRLRGSRRGKRPAAGTTALDTAVLLLIPTMSYAVSCIRILVKPPLDPQEMACAVTLKPRRSVGPPSGRTADPPTGHA